ncbi:uncharacterized protein LOC124292308 isoform X3 [Haliotis rubra]|uniref:uncharacterized protein LOC124292308 isoform X3 n=1 Tax=Haliotis rubra TaxID=36100 RepID=UPI001EE5BAC7|nr:uncharacterized protein LOC124292308 isoform X3 [Haliotis rubra]
MAAVGWTLVCLLSAISCIGRASGWASMKEGDCPNNHQPGDTWHEGACSRCDCHAEGYACYGCGFVNTPTNCYTDTPHATDVYPLCCQVQTVCPGDKGFDHAKLRSNRTQ